MRTTRHTHDLTPMVDTIDLCNHGPLLAIVSVGVGPLILDGIRVMRGSNAQPSVVFPEVVVTEGTPQRSRPAFHVDQPLADAIKRTVLTGYAEWQRRVAAKAATMGVRA